MEKNIKLLCFINSMILQLAHNKDEISEAQIKMMLSGIKEYNESIRQRKARQQEK